MKKGISFTAILMLSLGWPLLARSGWTSASSSSSTIDDGVVPLPASFTPVGQQPIYTSSGYVLLLRPCYPLPNCEGWVRVYGADGSDLGQVKPARDLTGITRFAPWGADVDRAGTTLVIAGTAVSAGGELYGTLLLYTLSGRLVKEIRTGARQHLDVGIDREGRIWSFGTDADAERAGEDFPLVVCYSPEGKLLKGEISRSQLPAQIDVGSEGPQLGGRFFFRLTDQGFYFWIPQTQQLFEADYSGEILSTFSALKPDLGAKADPQRKTLEKYIDGLAMTSSGQVFAQFEEEFSKNGQQGFAIAHFRLNRATGRWEQASPASATPDPGRLLGARGESLVFLVADGAAYKLAIVSLPR